MGARRKKSGKRSAANSKRRRRARRPAPLTFFIDECLGGGLLAAALRAKDQTVILCRERFPEGTEDQEWLTVAGAERWVVLTKDKHIRRRELELQALVLARVRAFVLTSGDLTGSEQAALFVRLIPKMSRISRSTQGPLVAAVTSGGTVTILKTRRFALRKKKSH